LLIHGLADDNIPPQQSEMIRARNSNVVLWEVPGAGHADAINAANQEFAVRVLDWFSSHGASPGYQSVLNNESRSSNKYRSP
jgi:dipeptidyl aminopeptidase/acylaminoacyl peptidase